MASSWYAPVILVATFLLCSGILYFWYRKSDDEDDITITFGDPEMGFDTPSGGRRGEREVELDPVARVKRLESIRSRFEFREIKQRKSRSKKKPSDPIVKSEKETKKETKSRKKNKIPSSIETKQAMTTRKSTGSLQQILENGLLDTGLASLDACCGTDLGRAVGFTTGSNTPEWPPKDVLILKDWEERPGNHIRGRVYGSSKFRDGDFIETTKIVKGTIANGCIVSTKSKRKYYLENMKVNDELSISNSRKDGDDRSVATQRIRTDLAGGIVQIESSNSTKGNALDKTERIQEPHIILDNTNRSFGSASEKSFGSRSISRLYPSAKDKKNLENCSICLEPYRVGETVVRLKKKKSKKKASDDPTITEKSCPHWFHEECILEWLATHDECPLCRMDMVNDKRSNTVEDRS